MNKLPVLACVAAIVACAIPASAQCPASGAVDMPNGEPISLILKYSWKLSEVKPTALKTALEKLPTVVRTAFDDKIKNQILVKFKGRCDQVSALETAARNSGVPAYVINHAHVSIVLKVKPGADIKAAIDAIGKVPGALYSKMSGASGLEVHADLNQLSIDDINTVVSPFKCEAIVNQTFEYVRYKVTEGSAEAFQAAAGLQQGVMVARLEGDVVGAWLNKAAVKPEALEKIEGFKVKRL